MDVFRVLLVEHNVEPNWQDILARKIRSALSDIDYQDYEIKIAATFNDAYQALTEQKWHLLITDLSLKIERQLPGIQLVQLAYDLGIPSLAITGSADMTFRRATELLEDKKRPAYCFDRGYFDYEKFMFYIQKFAREYMTLSAKDTNHTTSTTGLSVETIQNPEQPLEKTGAQFYALLIGIGSYFYVCPLSKTTNDAKDLYDALVKNGYFPKNIQLLLDKEATKTAINRNLDWLARHADVNDTVIIFFSGHGMQFVGGFSPGEYLCPIEAELDRAKDTCISSEEFANALRAIKAGRLVVLLDSCHSGGVGQPKDPDLQVKVGLTDTTYSNLSKGNGRVIIASCKPDEVSWELPEMPNGLFTHYLLKGLYGEAAQPDGTVSYVDLFGYISRNVPIHKSQHPFLKSEAENFVIFTTQLLNPNSPNIQSLPPSSSSGFSQERQPISITPNLTKLRKAILSVYDRPSFEIFCTDLELNYDNLRGETLEAKIMYLIEDFKRHRNLEQLVNKVLTEHSYLESEIQ